VIAVGPCWNIQAIGWLRPRQLHVEGGGMKLKRASIVVARVVIGAAVAGGLCLAYPVQMSTLGGMTRNCLISLSPPPGTTTTELNAASKAGLLRARRSNDGP
jgi:hypothetical protein